jgi:hypothetical protein
VATTLTESQILDILLYLNLGRSYATYIKERADYASFIYGVVVDEKITAILDSLQTLEEFSQTNAIDPNSTLIEADGLKWQYEGRDANYQRQKKLLIRRLVNLLDIDPSLGRSTGYPGYTRLRHS